MLTVFIIIAALEFIGLVYLTIFNSGGYQV